MTNREFYNAVINANVSEEITSHAQDALVALDNRNEKRRNTLTKEQKANEEIKAEILKGISLNFHTAKEIAEGLELSTQKVSALCRQLVESGALISKEVKVKGKSAVKAYFLAE